MSCRRGKSRFFIICDKSKESLNLVSKAKWNPPKSPFNLVQESLFHNPWQLLIATIFLQRTKGEMAIPLIHKFFEKWPRPKDVLQAALNDIACLIQPIGLNKRRAFVIKKFTGNYCIVGIV